MSASSFERFEAPLLHTKKLIRRDGSSVNVFSQKRQLGLLIKSSQKTIRGSSRATAVFVAEIFHSALNGSHRSAYNGEATGSHIDLTCKKKSIGDTGSDEAHQRMKLGMQLFDRMNPFEFHLCRIQLHVRALHSSTQFSPSFCTLWTDA